MKRLFIVIALLPVAYAVAYFFFPGVRPTPSDDSVFLRVTGAGSVPASVDNLEVHSLGDPLLGDGLAAISFTISEHDGRELSEGIEFLEPSRISKEEVNRMKRLPITIDDPLVGSYRDNNRGGNVITNLNRTRFFWAGSI